MKFKVRNRIRDGSTDDLPRRNGSIPRLVQESQKPAQNATKCSDITRSDTLERLERQMEQVNLLNKNQYNNIYSY